MHNIRTMAAPRKYPTGMGFAEISIAEFSETDALTTLQDLNASQTQYCRENYEPYRIEMDQSYGRTAWWVWCPARQNNPAGLQAPPADWRPWLQ